MTVFSGDIENEGTLATAFNGVLLDDIKTFVGDVNNKGTISAGSGGIAIGGSQIDGTLPVATFAGNIVNIGTIVAKTGFSVLDSTILGALVDSGTIRAASAGIEVNSAAVIVGGIQVSSKGTITAHITSGTGGAIWHLGAKHHDVWRRHHQQRYDFWHLFAIWLSGVSTFAGGISNRGVISGGVGILLSQLSTFAGGPGSGGAIVNSGKITGTFDGIRVVLVEPCRWNCQRQGRHNHCEVCRRHFRGRHANQHERFRINLLGRHYQ